MERGTAKGHRETKGQREMAEEGDKGMQGEKTRGTGALKQREIRDSEAGEDLQKERGPRRGRGAGDPAGRHPSPLLPRHPHCCSLHKNRLCWPNHPGRSLGCDLFRVATVAMWRDTPSK